MLAVVGHAVICTDISARIQYWNRAAEDLFGYAAAEVAGRPVFEVVAAGGDEDLLAQWSARVRAGEPYAGDWRVRDKAGRIFIVAATLTPMRGDGDAVLGCVGVFYDVSVQREGEARARRLAAIVDGSDQAIIEAGPDGRIRSANQAVGRVFGCTPEELIDRDLAVLVPQEHAAELAASCQSVLAGRQVGALATHRRREDGSLMVASLQFAPVHDECGNAVGVSVITRDVTLETHTRAALAASERRYRARFDQAGMPQAIADLDGIVLKVNDAMCRLLGRERAQLEGVALRSLSHLGDNGLTDEQLSVGLVGEAEAASWERVLLHGDGTPLPVLVHAALMRSADGVPEGIAAFLQDLSALRRAESALARREAKFEAFALRASEWVLVMDRSGALLFASDAVTRLLGYDAPSMPGRSGWDLVHPDELPDVRRAFEAVLFSPGGSLTVEFRMCDAAGAWHWVEQAFTNRMDDPDIGGVVCNGRDVTARVAAEQALRESEMRYRSIAETTQEGIWVAEASGRTLFANHKLAEILGVSIETIYEQSVSTILDPDDPAFVIDRLLHRGESGAQQHELCYSHPDGARRMLRLNVSQLLEEGRADSLAMIADVTEARRIEDALRHRALHDELTGLPNRSLLTDRLDQAIGRLARHGTGAIAVLFADLDQFKLVNDTWGHAAGDQLLVSVGARLESALHPGDTVSRFGGDEFVVVREDTDEVQARALAERLLAALVAPFDVGHQRFCISASIGIAVSPPQRASELLRFADAAMYDAKAAGRGRAHVFDTALAEESADRLELSYDLREALRGDELALHYQPIVDLTTGRVIGLEALARWDHPTRGAVAPSKFVRVAELTGLASALDRWAVERACRDHRQFREVLGAQPHIAVNISAGHLADPDFESLVLSAVAAHGVPAGGLTLEITESVLMNDPVHAGGLLQRLRDRGVTSSIDDFGTGYSSLAYLGRLPVSTLKIDRTFVERIDEDADDLAIAASMIDLARTMRMRSVAEGVETVRQAAVLQQLGCDAAQGFLWSGALPSGQLISELGALRDGCFTVPSPQDAAPPRPTMEKDGRVTDEPARHRVMSLHREGASLTTIAAALNTEGYRTPRGLRWQRTSVAAVISDIAYPQLWSATVPQD
ncbi:MAG: hypothetical protein QOI54_3705 [Actinomycetota bacterium]|jgi:diguanylate cyclase (GGDEF)-like protein/PAS domain S-box-containing protein|nr:hypothetical protein [Actinomycetota bacterium]